MIGYIALGICFFIFCYQYAVRRKREAAIIPYIHGDSGYEVQAMINEHYRKARQKVYGLKDQEEWLQSNWRKMLKDLAE